MHNVLFMNTMIIFNFCCKKTSYDKIIQSFFLRQFLIFIQNKSIFFKQ